MYFSDKYMNYYNKYLYGGLISLIVFIILTIMIIFIPQNNFIIVFFIIINLYLIIVIFYSYNRKNIYKETINKYEENFTKEDKQLIKNFVNNYSEFDEFYTNITSLLTPLTDIVKIDNFTLEKELNNLLEILKNKGWDFEIKQLIFIIEKCVQEKDLKILTNIINNSKDINEIYEIFINNIISKPEEKLRDNSFVYARSYELQIGLLNTYLESININKKINTLKEEIKYYYYSNCNYNSSKKRIPISNELKHEIWRRDKFTCQYCGKDINQVVLEIDHILPVSKGGTNAKSNLQTLCVKCNRKKSDH